MIIKTRRKAINNSEIVLIKQNIGTSGGDSTPLEAKSLNIPLIEVGTYRIDKAMKNI